MTIKERIHTIKRELRKKNGDKFLSRDIHILLKLENDIRKHTTRCFHDSKYELQFSGGDLRIISTTLGTKLTRFQKKLSYISISDKLNAMPVITDKEFIQVMNEAIADYEIFKKLSDCDLMWFNLHRFFSL